MARVKKSAPAARKPERPLISLDRHCGIRESAALREQLMRQLGNPEPVAIDPSGVERVDTAALQLLFAFERDRRSAGLDVNWQTGSAVLHQAAVRLGLRLGVPNSTPGQA